MLQQDVLSSALAALRVSGSLVLHHRYAPPWAIELPGTRELAALLGAEPEARVVAFHLVERGELELQAGRASWVLGPGELAACFGGVPHRLGRGRGARAQPLAEVLRRGNRAEPRRETPQVTQLLCGVFILRDPSLNPLLGALPSMLHARLLEDELELTGRLLLRELRQPGAGSAFLVDRALELLCASLLRQHLGSADRAPAGLFRALRDPGLCHALEQVHRDPGKPWTVQTLAARAGLSRSRFAARFTELAGEAPMTYVTRWRMNVAARLLRDGHLSVAQVASQVGYDSLPSFSRVFKRSLGAPPARFRDQPG